MAIDLLGKFPDGYPDKIRWDAIIDALKGDRAGGINANLGTRENPYDIVFVKTLLGQGGIDLVSRLGGSILYEKIPQGVAGDEQTFYFPWTRGTKKIFVFVVGFPQLYTYTRESDGTQASLEDEVGEQTITTIDCATYSSISTSGSLGTRLAGIDEKVATQAGAFEGGKNPAYLKEAFSTDGITYTRPALELPNSVSYFDVFALTSVDIEVGDTFFFTGGVRTHTITAKIVYGENSFYKYSPKDIQVPRLNKIDASFPAVRRLGKTWEYKLGSGKTGLSSVGGLPFGYFSTTIRTGQALALKYVSSDVTSVSPESGKSFENQNPQGWGNIMIIEI